MFCRKERNIIEAASAGASAAIKIVANVIANLIAFISMLHFLNSTLTWFGNRVGIEELTFEVRAMWGLKYKARKLKQKQKQKQILNY